MAKKNTEERTMRGIKAIIGLQAMAGITEAEEKARAGWGGMSKSEQETTLRVAGQLLDETAKKEKK